MRFTMRQFLEAEGYRVIEAENGKQVLSLFVEHNPDIILMDYIMPELNGVTACAQLQELPGGNTTPVIMITSLEDETSVNLAFESGATDYISKPINWAVLRKRLSRLLFTKHMEKTLSGSEAFASSILNHAVEGIITIDINGNIEYINPVAEKIFNYKATELIGKNINLLIPEFNYKNEKLINKNLELIGHREDKSVLPIELTLSKFFVDRECFITIIFHDITKHKNYEKTIIYQAFYDSLTGLPNRLLLRERILHEVSHCKHTNHKFALMHLDLDNFKLINDTLGHDIGDNLLKEIAVRLKKYINSYDTVARLGEDEYLILFSRINHEENIAKLADKFLKILSEPFIINKHELYISASIGITIYPDDGEDAETLLTNADIAMYRAKENGKNNFQIFTPYLNQKSLERLELANYLRHALEYNEFIIHYQPKVDTKTEKVVGMEALIRWQHPNLGLVSPQKFIPLAEETGQIIPIGEWVLRTACAQNKALQDAGLPPLTVAVNLSPLQFRLQNLTKIVYEILKETGLEPQYLELEITESIAMENVEHTIKTINNLKELGIKFAIDDFGTGYSSLSQLNSLSVNKIKIDKSFVSQIDGGNFIIASTIIALGKSLKLEIVAEGVETQRQADFFKENACDELQGYFYGKPMSDKDFFKYYYETLKKI
ncbi:EAL domain-containing protein [Clostridium sp. SYSU_GA19001]|nr:EAL domain-containing protein [Clostridium caldaquaticum]